MPMDDLAGKYRRTTFLVLVVAVAALSLFVMAPFVPAILWATVLTVLMWPIHERVQRWVQGTRLPDGIKLNLGPLVTVLATILIICIPFALVGFGIWVQVKGLAEQVRVAEPGSMSLDGILVKLDAALRPFLTQIGQASFSLKEYAHENREAIVDSLRAPAAKVAQSAGVTVLTVIFALLTQFFMLRDSARLKQPAIQLIPLPPDRAEAVLFRVRDTIRAVFVGVVLVALIQGATIGVAYAVFQVPNALLLAVASFMLACIPLLGSPLIYVPVALALAADGRTTDALWILGIGFGIVSNIDNVLRPFVIGAQVRLHPIAIFFSLLGGVLAMGPIGLMAGPMLLTVVLAVIDILRERIELDQGAKAVEPA